MLNNNFYYIQSINSEPENIAATLQLNPEHKIFEGHFPGQPVVPGVCQVQIIKEILEGAIGKNLQLKTADHIKFLSVIIPDNSSIINAAIKYAEDNDGISFTASLTKEDKICLKMRGVFVSS